MCTFNKGSIQSLCNTVLLWQIVYSESVFGPLVLQVILEVGTDEFTTIVSLKFF